MVISFLIVSIIQMFIKFHHYLMYCARRPLGHPYSFVGEFFCFFRQNSFFFGSQFEFYRSIVAHEPCKVVCVCEVGGLHQQRNFLRTHLKCREHGVDFWYYYVFYFEFYLGKENKNQMKAAINLRHFAT